MSLEGVVRIASLAAGGPGSPAREVLARLGTQDLSGVLLFCSGRADLERIACEVRQERRDLTVVGCTTAGEITPAGRVGGTITAVGFPAADFTLQAVRFRDMANFDPFAAHRAVAGLAAEASARSAALGPHARQAAILLIDGLSRREELVTHTLQHVLEDIPLVGGSAGDDAAAGRTRLLFEAAFESDCAVLAILTSRRPLGVFRSHHHMAGAALGVVTRADAAARRVDELNGARAAGEYARLVGVAQADLCGEVFARHPMMVRVGGEYHARAVHGVDAGGGLVFQSAIDNGLVLRIGHASDPMGALRASLEACAAEAGAPAAVIAFESAQNSGAAARDLFSRYGLVGFRTLGEQFRELHVNRSLVGLMIGRDAP
jgi:hypothetical protein